MTDSNETAARQALVAQYRRLGALRLNELASGNASCRFGDGMLISPTGASAETITEDSVVFVGPNGDWAGDHKPSSEWMMHAALYRSDPATGAVTWNVPVRDIDDLTNGNAEFVDDDSLLVQLADGTNAILDTSSGKTTAVPPGQVFWCIGGSMARLPGVWEELSKWPTVNPDEGWHLS